LTRAATARQGRNSPWAAVPREHWQNDNGVVSVSSLWADESVYYPLHVNRTPQPTTSSGARLTLFRTKPQIALELVQQAVAMQLPFKAVVADCSYGEHREFKQGWMSSGRLCACPQAVTRLVASGRRTRFPLGGGPCHSFWRLAGCAGRVPRRTYRDLVGTGSDGRSLGVDKSKRAVVVTTDLATLPEQSTWYLVTNLPAPESEPVEAGTLAVADVAVRFYGLRMWVEQSR